MKYGRCFHRQQRSVFYPNAPPHIHVKPRCSLCHTPCVQPCVPVRASAPAGVSRLAATHCGSSFTDTDFPIAAKIRADSFDNTLLLQFCQMLFNGSVSLAKFSA